MSTMKISIIFLCVVVTVFSMSQIGSAERLYHWVDSKGVSHISRQPPSEGAQSAEVMEYSVRRKKPPAEAPTQPETAAEKQPEPKDGEKSEKTEAQPATEGDAANTCYLKAGSRDIYVYVTEERSPGSSYRNILFKGDIPSRRRQLIKSTRGKIRFSYQLSAEGRSVGDNQAECVNGNVIAIE